MACTAGFSRLHIRHLVALGRNAGGKDTVVTFSAFIHAGMVFVAEIGVTYFSHKYHSGMYKCGECHNGIFTTGVAAKRYKMADMEAGKSCGACHDAKSAFTVKENC